MTYLDERRDFIERGRPLKQKKIYSIPKKSEKRKAKEKQEREAGGENEMDVFFDKMRNRMIGRCFFCNGKTEKDNDETYRRSIAHFFPKAIFPSIATHPDNWFELCFFGNSCHTNLDNHIITFELLKDSKEWEIIVEKFHELAPLLTDEERAHKFYRNLETLIYAK